MKLFNMKHLGVLFLSLFFGIISSITMAHAKVEHFKVTPVVFASGENVKNVVTEISSFSCPYCYKTFKKDFKNYMALVKSKRIKFVYVPTLIHGPDVKINQIFYLFPKYKQPAMISLLFNTRDTWVKSADPIGALVKIVGENTGLSAKTMYNAFKDKAYAQEITDMSNHYFNTYKEVKGTPSYLLNDKFVPGASVSYKNIVKLLK